MCEVRAEILLASYNGAAFIGEQIDSILAQTDRRWHLTVSDDGSTDGTDAILDAYAQRYPDRIARVYSGQRFGNARDHFFWLMNQCDAPYMLFSDQDDVFYPQKVEKTLNALLEAEEKWDANTPILVFTDQTPTDEHLRPLAPSLMRYQKQYFAHFDYRSILMQNVVTGGAMGINRALARLGGRCEDTSQVIMHDWWLAAVAARFGQVIYIDEPLSDYRQHGGNCVGAKDVGSVSHILYKLRHMEEIRETLIQKKKQALIFERTFCSMLMDKDNVFLNRFCLKRSGAIFYLQNYRCIHGFFRLAGMMLLG